MILNIIQLHYFHDSINIHTLLRIALSLRWGISKRFFKCPIFFLFFSLFHLLLSSYPCSSLYDSFDLGPDFHLFAFSLVGSHSSKTILIGNQPIIPPKQPKNNNIKLILLIKGDYNRINRQFEELGSLNLAIHRANNLPNQP